MRLTFTSIILGLKYSNVSDLLDYVSQFHPSFGPRPCADRMPYSCHLRSSTVPTKVVVVVFENTSHVSSRTRPTVLPTPTAGTQRTRRACISTVSSSADGTSWSISKSVRRKETVTFGISTYVLETREFTERFDLG